MASGWQGAPFFRRYGRELVSKNRLLRQKNGWRGYRRISVKSNIGCGWPLLRDCGWYIRGFESRCKKRRNALFLFSAWATTLHSDNKKAKKKGTTVTPLIGARVVIELPGQLRDGPQNHKRYVIRTPVPRVARVGTTPEHRRIPPTVALTVF